MPDTESIDCRGPSVEPRKVRSLDATSHCSVGGGFWRQTTHIGDAGREGKMGKSQSEGGASTYIYGLIFVLYAGIAVVLFIYMMHKRYTRVF